MEPNRVPHILDINLDMQMEIVGFLNIFHVGLLRLTSKTNLASNILSWTKILNLEVDIRVSAVPRQERIEYLNLLLDTMISSKAKPEVFVIETKYFVLPKEIHDKLARLAPHFRIFHFANYSIPEREDVDEMKMPWLIALNGSRLIDFKLSFDDTCRNVRSKILLPFIESIAACGAPSLRRLALSIRRVEIDMVSPLLNLAFPELETINFYCEYRIKEELVSAFTGNTTERTRLRPKLRKLNFCFNRSIQIDRPDLVEEFLGIDVTQSLPSLAEQIERIYGVHISGFHVDSTSLWCYLLKAKRWDINDPSFEELFRLCYPDVDELMTEGILQDRLSQLSSVPFCFDIHNAWDVDTEKDYIVTAYKLVRVKAAEQVSKFPRFALEPFTDAAYEKAIDIDPMLTLYATMVESAMRLGLTDEAQLAWSETKKLLLHRKHMSYLFSNIPRVLFSNLFQESPEWLGQFDLNQYLIDYSEMRPFWRTLDIHQRIKIFQIDSFNPNIVDEEYGDILSSITESSSYQKPLSQEIHAAIQAGLPRLDPALARNSWFYRESDIYSNPQTSAVFLDYIWKHWQSIKPSVKLITTLEALEKLKEYASSLNQEIPHGLLRRVAESTWTTIVSRSKSKEQLQLDARRAKELIGFAPEYVAGIVEGRIGTHVPQEDALAVLAEFTPKEESSCVVS